MAETQKKQFTPKEANKRLPLVKQIVEDILLRGKELKDLTASSAAKAETSAQGLALRSEIQELMQELEALGCYYKDWDFETGLVDFPGIIDGHPVFFCWSFEEKEVRFFHDIDESFNCRKVIPAHYLN
ncbi:MAG: DUF2203 domain-containing protein [Candidatus Omnitrophica bacterium]|nr:DUF2203 domain-containing protein [Candidatus Omnitrophota bacterium]